jgi:FkbM family methyltransferase
MTELIIQDIKVSFPLKIHIRPNTTDIKVIKEVLVKNVYEKPSMDFIIEKDETWFDFGANIGTFAMLVLIKGGYVICYEPEKENFDILTKNIMVNFDHPENEYDNRFILVNKGVDDGQGEGTIDLYLCKGDYNKYRHSIYETKGRKTIEIQVQGFKSVLASNSSINCIKMDIEGAEIEILESMTLKDWKNTNINKMVFEYSFDVDSSIQRFLRIIDNLQLYFDLVHYTKVNDNESDYLYFPSATIVYCKGY